MAVRFGRNRNTNNESVMSTGISLNSSTTIVITVSNSNRMFFCFNNNDANQGVWLKLQSSSIDDDKKGIFVPKDSSWAMPVDNIYTGEISAIANIGMPVVYYTEY